MARERIASEDGQQEAVVSWIDDGETVQLGMVWDGVEAQRERQMAAMGVTPGSTVVLPIDTEVVPGVPANPPIQACQDADGRWSIYMDLPRSRINALIRALRRGRNKAYGSDE